MTVLVVTWKPPLTHLRDEEDSGATLCGVPTGFEWENGMEVTVHDVMTERAAGCLRCKRIAEARMADAIAAEHAEQQKELARRNPPRGYLVRHAGSGRLTWVSATKRDVMATRTWDGSERALCIADAWRHFDRQASP